MMTLDPVLPARIQFAMTAGFHFIFPLITIGLVWILVGVEFAAWRKQSDQLLRLGKFFGKLFALTFAVGVATGITMEFQFGTNWSQYAKTVGDIFGAPLAIEVIFAFFLESTMLGLYLFGRNRVPRWVHVGSITLVAVAATMSAFWILVANSWQQTPAGYRLHPVTGQPLLADFWAAVFNPSTLPRFFHTFTAALVTGAFFVGGVAAWLLLKNGKEPVARTALRIALLVGFIGSVAELFPFGHHHAVQVARTQPEKLATLEGLFETTANAPLLVFGIPTGEERIAMPIRVPGLLSLLAGNRFDTVVQGRNAFPKEELPPIFLPFVAFHGMLALGMLFIGLTGLGILLMVWGRLYEFRLFLYGLLLASPLPLVASQLGWVTAEVGRQPWAVYRLLRTSDAVSTVVGPEAVLFSIILFGAVYALLGILYIYLLVRLVKKGPEPASAM